MVLAYTTPLWVTPGAALLLGEPLTPRRAVGVLVGLAGLVTLLNPLALDWTDRTTVLGNLAIVVAALLWAASILHIRAHRWRSTPFALIPWETLLSTLLLAISDPDEGQREVLQRFARQTTRNVRGLEVGEMRATAMMSPVV